MIKTAGIGYPLSHSKSPIIYDYWMKQFDQHGCYDLKEFPPEQFDEGIQNLIDEGYAGFSVTLPHKQAVMQRCDSLDETAKAIGAVNSVVIKDGQLHGYNTDAFGFIENLRQSLPNFEFTKGPAVVLGAGGAARAVLYGLLQEGVSQIILCNRTRKKAEELSSMSASIQVVDWDKKENYLEDANLLVNTTSLGMTGQRELEINIESLASKCAVYDIVYAPLYTKLLQDAQKKGNPIITGIGMLLHQARPSFQRWFGIQSSVSPELEELILS